MTLDQLNYFIETAKLQHLGRAAKKLAISPSAVSQAISTLEQEFGGKLFEKSGKNIMLTEHGRLLLKKGENLLNNANKLVQEMSTSEVELKGELKISSTHVLSHEYLVPIIGKLALKHSNIKIDLQSLRSFEVIQSVISGDTNLGFCFSPQPHPTLKSHIVLKDRLVLAVKKHHPVLSLPKKKQLENLIHYPSILPRAYGGIDICIEHPMLKKYRLDKCKLLLTFDHYQVAEAMANHSHAWTFIPQKLIEDKNCSLVPIHHPQSWKAPYTINFIWRKDYRLTRIDQLILNSFI